MLSKPTQSEVIGMIADLNEIAKLRGMANALEDRVRALADVRRSGNYVHGATVLMLELGTCPDLLDLHMNRTQEVARTLDCTRATGDDNGE